MKLDREENKNNLKRICDGIQPSLNALGMQGVIKEKDKNGEKLHSPRIEITHPEYSDFNARLTDHYSDGQAHLYCDYNREVARSSSERYYSSDKYEFELFLSNEELETIGIEKANYRYDLQQLNVRFKATKNIKLILRDILPRLKKYLEVIKLVSPRIDERIQRQKDVLALQAKVARYANQSKPIHLSDRSYNLPFGCIFIHQNGSITLNQALTRDELETMLKTLDKQAA